MGGARFRELILGAIHVKDPERNDFKLCSEEHAEYCLFGWRVHTIDERCAVGTKLKAADNTAENCTSTKVDFKQ